MQRWQLEAELLGVLHRASRAFTLAAMYHWVGLDFCVCSLAKNRKFRKLIVVYDLRVGDMASRTVMHLAPVAGFEWKEGYEYWHKVWRRKVHDVYFYELMEPVDAMCKTSE